jgi:hypothetical protein
MAQVKVGNLLYRATRDGFTASAFHEKCDGKENTITIIKTNGNYVFGGYTSAKWNSNNVEATNRFWHLIFIFNHPFLMSTLKMI